MKFPLLISFADFDADLDYPDARWNLTGFRMLFPFSVFCPGGPFFSFFFIYFADDPGAVSAVTCDGWFTTYINVVLPKIIPHLLVTSLHVWKNTWFRKIALLIRFTIYLPQWGTGPSHRKLSGTPYRKPSRKLH